MEEIEDEIDCKQCKVAWDTINEISVRKTSKRGMSKADNPAESSQWRRQDFLLGGAENGGV